MEVLYGKFMWEIHVGGGSRGMGGEVGDSLPKCRGERGVSVGKIFATSSSAPQQHKSVQSELLA